MAGPASGTTIRSECRLPQIVQACHDDAAFATSGDVADGRRANSAFFACSGGCARFKVADGRRQAGSAPLVPFGVVAGRYLRHEWRAGGRALRRQCAGAFLARDRGCARCRVANGRHQRGSAPGGRRRTAAAYGCASSPREGARASSHSMRREVVGGNLLLARVRSQM